MKNIIKTNKVNCKNIKRNFWKMMLLPLITSSPNLSQLFQFLYFAFFLRAEDIKLNFLICRIACSLKLLNKRYKLLRVNTNENIW